MAAQRIGVTIHHPLCEKLFSPAAREKLNALGDVRWTDADTPLSVAEGAKFLADCEIGLGSWGTPYPSPELLAACPRLRLWEHVAGSVKHMFGPHLSGRDLVIASCAPAIAENVAEMTVGEILLGVRGVFPNAADNRRAAAAKPLSPRSVTGLTVGVIGASAVGRRVIRMLRPFGPRLLLFDPFVTAEAARELGVERCEDLLNLCRRADVLTLHTPATDATLKLLRADHFRALPDHAIFINTSRGACIDEAALIAELERGRLFAFLDVTDPEPAAADSPLRRQPNAVLTSHIAGPADWKMGEQAADDVARFLRGERPERVVSAEMLATIA